MLTKAQAMNLAVQVQSFDNRPLFLFFLFWTFESHEEMITFVEENNVLENSAITPEVFYKRSEQYFEQLKEAAPEGYPKDYNEKEVVDAGIVETIKVINSYLNQLIKAPEAVQSLLCQKLENEIIELSLCINTTLSVLESPLALDIKLDDSERDDQLVNEEFSCLCKKFLQRVSNEYDIEMPGFDHIKFTRTDEGIEVDFV
tara:strand:- start:2258 stop:2860 length:603 start_codon:yes stop_codon:yes gene_type:complete